MEPGETSFRVLCAGVEAVQVCNKTSTTYKEYSDRRTTKFMNEVEEAEYEQRMKKTNQMSPEIRRLRIATW